MMRLIGVGLLFICCTGSGFWLSNRLSGRVSSLNKAERMLSDMIGMVKNQNLPTGEILSRLSAEGYFAKDEQDAAAALEHFSENPLFQPAERVILVRVGQILGASDRESQTARLELELHSLKQLLSQAEEEKTVKGKLFRTMGLLLGSLAIVLAV